MTAGCIVSSIVKNHGLIYSKDACATDSLIAMKNIFTIALSLILCTLIQAAPVQRMGIPTSNYALAPQSSKMILAYCLDLHRSTPRSTNHLHHVLTNIESAIIESENQRVPLQVAIDRGWIRLSGRDLEPIRAGALLKLLRSYVKELPGKRLKALLALRLLKDADYEQARREWQISTWKWMTRKSHARIQVSNISPMELAQMNRMALFWLEKYPLDMVNTRAFGSPIKRRHPSSIELAELRRDLLRSMHKNKGSWYALLRPWIKNNMDSPLNWGDPSFVRIANLTDRRLQVHFRSRTVLSEQRESLDGLPLTYVRDTSADGESWSTIQNDLWNRDLQRKLIALGFAGGTDEDFNTERLRLSTEAFKKALGIRTEDNLQRPALAWLITKAQGVQRALKHMYIQDASEQRIWIEQLQAPLAMVLVVADNDKPLGLHRSASLHLTPPLVRPDNRPVRFDMKGFSGENAAILATRLRLQLATEHPHIQSRTVLAGDKNDKHSAARQHLYPRIKQHRDRWTLSLPLTAATGATHRLQIEAATRELAFNRYQRISRALIDNPELLEQEQSALESWLSEQLPAGESPRPISVTMTTTSAAL